MPTGFRRLRLRNRRRPKWWTRRSNSSPRELDSRSADGLEVTLLWSKPTNALTVAVNDTRTGEAFTLRADAANALDVFHHPYAYAADLAA